MPGPASSEDKQTVTGLCIEYAVRRDFFICDLFAKMYDFESSKYCQQIQKMEFAASIIKTAVVDQIL